MILSHSVGLPLRLPKGGKGRRKYLLCWPLDLQDSTSYHPAAATACPVCLLFICSPSALTAGEVGEVADEDVSLESSEYCKPFGAEAEFGLLSKAKTCGRHLARCFAVGALASSSVHVSKKGEGAVSENLQFRHRSSRASIAISRAGGFIRIK